MQRRERTVHVAIALCVFATDAALATPAVQAGLAVRGAVALGLWLFLRRTARIGASPVEAGWSDAGKSIAWTLRLLGRWLLPASLVLALVSWLATTWFGVPPLRLPVVADSRQAAISFLFQGIIAAPAVEELIYRGLIQPRLRLALGPCAAVFFSGLLFWGVHGVDGEGAARWNQLAGGWVLAWAGERTGSLVAPTLLHALGNAVLLAACLLNA